MKNKRVVILGGVFLAFIFFLCFHLYNLSSEQERAKSLEKLSDELKASE
ncbi:putative lipoprotein [Acinetobacter baumannii 348935]|nr:putative lipoprotein [Acinetobacter baumannii 348935]